MLSRVLFGMGAIAAWVGGCSSHEGSSPSGSQAPTGPSCHASTAPGQSDACSSCAGTQCASESQCAEADCADYFSCYCGCAEGDSSCYKACGSKLTPACTSCFTAIESCQRTMCASECGAGASSGSPSGGSSSDAAPTSTAPASCTPQPVSMSCYEAAAGTCVEYTGSDYASAATASNFEQVCTGGGGTFGTGGCPTSNRLGGSCVLYCGQPTEQVAYFYAGSSTDAQSYCTVVQQTYVP